jgi:DNA-binding transcriptional LysR family regulator
MSPRYDLVDLRLFLHVAEAASITHGAKRSNMSLAAASERIRAMEAALGGQLLARGRRGVQLTPAGAILVQHARTVVQQLQQMRGDLDGYAKGLRGHVRLLVNTVAMLEYLPEMLSAFLALNASVDIDLEERKSPEIMRAVASRRADIGIVAGAVDPAMGLETMPFTNNLLVLAMPKRHALAARRKIPFAETLDHDYVSLGTTSALQEFVNQQAAHAGRRLKVRVQLNSFDGVSRMVAGGLGLAILPQAAARRWRHSLRTAALTDPWAVRHLTLCVRNRQSLSPQAAKLLAHLRECGPRGRQFASRRQDFGATRGHEQ